MSFREKVHELLKEVLDLTEEEVVTYDFTSVGVAQEIAFYAHYGQRRLNSDMYIVHPDNVLKLYRKFVGIIEDDYFCLDSDLLCRECNVPYEGVQEVCLLHDVLEDSSVTIEEISELFEEVGLKTHFDLYIKTPLLLITHDKSDDYDKYIEKLIEHPTSALVKMLDMTDNMNPTTLHYFGEKELDRIMMYSKYCKAINDRYHFTENTYKYFAIRRERNRR